MDLFDFNESLKAHGAALEAHTSVIRGTLADLDSKRQAIEGVLNGERLRDFIQHYFEVLDGCTKKDILQTADEVGKRLDARLMQTMKYGVSLTLQEQDHLMKCAEAIRASLAALNEVATRVDVLTQQGAELASTHESLIWTVQEVPNQLNQVLQAGREQLRQDVAQARQEAVKVVGSAPALHADRIAGWVLGWLGGMLLLVGGLLLLFQPNTETLSRTDLWIVLPWLLLIPGLIGTVFGVFMVLNTRTGH